VSLGIYDVSGARVRTLVNETVSAGPHEVMWDGRSDGGAPVASGVYVYRLRSGNSLVSRKMLLLK
jgi:flagellar hook assembly protein FlgD